jgi:N-formylglutamate amidohydrolase
MAVSTQRWWTVQHGAGPIVATAIHHGHELRREVAEAIALEDSERLREEDPFTGDAVRDVPVHIVVHRSRFEFDLNRGADGAVYLGPEQCWGMKVWKQAETNESLVGRSLAIHAEYYRMLSQLLDGIAGRYERFLLIDVHSYNHRRGGPDAPPAPPEQAPDINIGTFSMPRAHWAFLVDPLIDAMRRFDCNGRRLDVRENVAFQGRGEQTRFVHQRYKRSGCAIALEIKKFYMDEWTGTPDPSELAAMRALVAHIARTAEEILSR